MFKKILVPHAGTLEGDIALDHAIKLAQLCSSEITILHVIEDLPTMPVLYIHAVQAKKIKDEIKRVIKEMKKVMETEMNKKIEKCEKNKVPSYLKISSGFPDEEIQRIVENQKIDLVVMAKRRKLKGFKKLLRLGSVSRKVAENTSCPVLLIDVEKLKN
ncbi:MAG: universal stress protein [Nitrosopumilaceae archaeon]|jgi:nucleotide-binding universal stress UspA family protein